MLQLRESGIADGVHLPETVSILAIEKGIYEYESMSMEVGKQELLLGTNNTLVTLERDNINGGTFIAGLQSTNSVVPATINTQFSTTNEVLVRLDFENCSGRGDSIKAESVSYVNIIGQGNIIACLPDTGVVDTTISTPIRPLAVFIASPYEGEAPFEVSFDASSSIDIDGEIVSYQWNFGEGNTGTGMLTTHTFQDYGKYVVQLVVIDNQGLSDTSELIIDAGLEPIPPEAALSVSSQIGSAPFPVMFDATISSDPDGDIASFLWTIGEEEIGTEESFVYEFTEEGIYVVQLIVTDDTGLRDTVSISITVVQGNVPPQADFSYFFDPGDSFQKVSFDASNSNDRDGQILSYKWDFGDGEKGEGKVVKHTYPDEGTYLVTLSVEDDSSAKDTYGIPVTVKKFSQDTTVAGVDIDCSDSTWVIGEVGSVTTTDQNERVSFQNTYKNPVVITGGFRRSGAHHTTVRVQNVSTNGFDIRLIDWECRNPAHGPEKIPYMVVESGTYQLPNGKKLMAGNYSLVTHEWGQRLFPGSFDELPILLSQVITENESDPVVVQFDKTLLEVDKFTMRLHENRRADSVHAPERVGVVAVEPGVYSNADFSFETADKDFPIGPSIRSIPLRQTYESTPVVFGSIQTTNENLSATVHTRSVGLDTVRLSLDYENCSNFEGFALEEQMNYLTFGGGGNIYACGLGVENGGESENPGVGANNEPALRFQLFPIPTQNEITLLIEEEGTIFGYEIINYAGQRVTEGLLGSGENIVRLDQLSPGIYLMNVYNEENMASSEFIVY